MMALDLAIDVVQFAVLLVLAVANGFIAYSVYRIQRDRNTPKLFVSMDLVEEEDREYHGLYLHNVGLVPALNVRVVADIEEWREGRVVKSTFHERYDAFHDRLVTLSPQERVLYELPAIEGWALTVTVLASCSNGPDDSAHFVLGDDPSALRQVILGNESKKAIKRLKSRAASRIGDTRGLNVVLGLNSLKDYGEFVEEESEQGCDPPSAPGP